MDAMQFNADSDNTTIVHGLLILKQEMSLKRLQELIMNSLCLHKRFRSKIVRTKWSWPYFEEVMFSIEEHVFSGERIKNHQEFEDKISEFLSIPLCADKPLWEMHLVPYKNGCGIIYRFHHCVADGVAMLRIILSALDRIPVNKVSTEIEGSKSVNNRKRKNNPGLWMMFLTGFYAFKKLLLQPTDPISILRPKLPIELETKRSVRWLEHPIELARVKAIAHETSTTVNDVLLSCLSGALRAWVMENASPEEPLLRSPPQSVIWVSRRPLDLDIKKIEWGNDLGAFYFTLPTNESDRLSRLSMINKQSTELKNSPEPIFANLLIRLFGLLPPVVGRFLWYLLAFKVTLSISNVPGPTCPLAFDGCEIEQFQFFVGPQRTIGSFVCIMRCVYFRSSFL